MTPEDFSRAFAYAFGDHDAEAMADLLADDGSTQTLTGIWAEGRTEARQAFEAEGLPVLSLWGSVPHYVHNTTNPKAAIGFLSEILELTGFSFDSSALAEQAFEWERGVDDMTASDEEMLSYVSQLEKARDAWDSEQVSGEALAREFERYLNDRPDSQDRPKS